MTAIRVRSLGLGIVMAALVTTPFAAGKMLSVSEQADLPVPPAKTWETIKKFALLPADLTESNGELTASMKVKRKVVEAKYKQILDAFYTGGRD